MFHRIEDIESMTAERFFSFALRLMAYEGALRFTAQQEEHDSRNETPGSPNRSPSASATDSDGKRHYRDIKHNPELAQYFD